MYIYRHIERTVKEIAERKGVLIVTGARQVGKSTMLRRQFGDSQYITLDRPSEYLLAKENAPAFFKMRKDRVIIDEIQRAPELFEYIKHDIDELIYSSLDGDKNYLGKYILTGSQSFRLMKNVSESLAGRAGIVEMSGLSLREIEGEQFFEPFLPTERQLMQRKMDAFDYNKVVQIIHRGSYPELYKDEISGSAWINFYESYIQTYIEKDIRELSNIQNEAAFLRFLRAVASRTGQELNLSALSEVCGKEVNTVKSWISTLETSGLVVLVQPYYNNATSRMIKTPKMYMLDTGLACFLGGWNTPEQLIKGAMWGAIFETFVVTQILKSYYNSGLVSPKIYFYRDKNQREIDLVIEEGGTLYPIEIKAGVEPNKSMCSNFEVLTKIADKNLGEGAVISMTSTPRPLTQTAWAINVNQI